MQKVGIIGGGPAGLAAAVALNDAGIDFELFDAGPALHARRHDWAEELATGIGGAGLFSDGKFSFYPSGSQLYEVADAGRLRRSYCAIADIADRAGIDVPPFPDLDWTPLPEGSFGKKDYPSSYGTLDQRIRLVADLVGAFEKQVMTGVQVQRIERQDSDYVLLLRADQENRRAGPFTSLVIASGRFGALALDDMIDGGLPLIEQRYEVGIRLEHPQNLGFLRLSTDPDVKFILRETGVEVRTFCTCRQGEVWMIPYDAMAALSGRSDGPPSAYCNFGLLPRSDGDRRGAGRDIWNDFRARFPDSRTALWQPLPDFLDGPGTVRDLPSVDERPWYPRDAFRAGDIAEALHPELRDVLRGSIRAIIERFPDLLSPETICLFPAVEGIGSFPDTDDDLKIPGESIWCCGDIVGRFRGLVPALISGHYAGSSVADVAGQTARTDAAWVREPV